MFFTFVNKLQQTSFSKKFLEKCTTHIDKKFQKSFFNGWHSWDATPWNHPWLTNKNLKNMSQYSQVVLEDLKRRVSGIDPYKYSFGFLGNIANNLYIRMVPLYKKGYKVHLFQHPQDPYIMSQPEWEEYDGTIKGSETNFNTLKESGYRFPEVEGLETIHFLNSDEHLLQQIILTKKIQHTIAFRQYAPDILLTPFLRKMDALWCSQCPYVGYLTGRPYLVSQMGGDVWFDCSRGDVLGLMQRIAFKKANMFLVSNPWSYAHARRYGFNHLLYLPLTLDETVYYPAYGKYRKEWEEKSGGKFFIFSTSRLNQEFKNNIMAIRGFSQFSKKYPLARLVLVDWGADKEACVEIIKNLNIQDKILWLPLSGKERLRDYYRSADCAFDQFVVGYFGGGGLEAMACGLPVIGKIKKDQYEASCVTGAPPILHAEQDLDIFNHLEMLYTDKNFHLTLREKTREWFIENHSAKKWLDTYLTVLLATALGIKPDFSKSPLNEAQTDEERVYYLDNMKKAPIFPNYTL